MKLFFQWKMGRHFARYQALFDKRHALKMQMEKEQRQREFDALYAKVQTFLDQEPGKYKIRCTSLS